MKEGLTKNNNNTMGKDLLYVLLGIILLIILSPYIVGFVDILWDKLESKFKKNDKQDKELLSVDLCARLPYGVKININREEDILLELGVDTGWVNASYDIEDVRPYLRPISSMTEEEKKEYKALCIEETFTFGTWQRVKWYDTWKSIDWLNAHHFDYRGLIEKGLAIEAPEGMYECK